MFRFYIPLAIFAYPMQMTIIPHEQRNPEQNKNEFNFFLEKNGNFKQVNLNSNLTLCCNDPTNTGTFSTWIMIVYRTLSPRYTISFYLQFRLHVAMLFVFW